MKAPPAILVQAGTPFICPGASISVFSTVIVALEGPLFDFQDMVNGIFKPAAENRRQLPESNLRSSNRHQCVTGAKLIILSNGHNFSKEIVMKTYHPELASERWLSMTIAEQLGNVGSEYERALRWKQRGEAVHFENAFARMLELLDLTIADPRWKNHRLKELTRLREVICEELWCEYDESTKPPDLRNYFLYFGILARSEREKALNADAL